MNDDNNEWMDGWTDGRTDDDDDDDDCNGMGCDGMEWITRNVFKNKTGRRIMDGEFYYRLMNISYSSERPNHILSIKVNK